MTVAGRKPGGALGLQGVELVLCGYNTTGWAPELLGTNPKINTKEMAKQEALFPQQAQYPTWQLYQRLLEYQCRQVRHGRQQIPTHRRKLYH